MSSFKFALAAAAFHVSAVLAHGFVDKITIDGQVFPGTNPFTPTPPTDSIVWPQTGGNGPITDVNNAQMTCGRITGSAQISATVAAGAKVEVSWNGAGFPWPAGDTGLGPLNHHGPVMNYLAKCNGKCSEQATENLNFVKIQERARIAAGPIPGFWGSDEMAKAGSVSTFNLPQGLAAGEYILRHEILALHDAQNSDPQFYPICANLIVTGDGSAPLPAGVPIPGPSYATSPFLKVNLFDGSLEGQDYVAPGPPVFDAALARREAWACTFARSNRRGSVVC
ncbi:glycosyl hydrolase family 61-domain-containing protein [Mycena vulgaris]|nr:glycosyl hydrolase family 61-domain-containing protein [Mycena vulgaris]